MDRNILRINATLEDRQVEHQSTIIEMESNVLNQTVSILIDPGTSLSYVSP